MTRTPTLPCFKLSITGISKRPACVSHGVQNQEEESDTHSPCRYRYTCFAAATKAKTGTKGGAASTPTIRYHVGGNKMATICRIIVVFDVVLMMVMATTIMMMWIGNITLHRFGSKCLEAYTSNTGVEVVIAPMIKTTGITKISYEHFRLVEPVAITTSAVCTTRNGLETACNIFLTTTTQLTLLT